MCAASLLMHFICQPFVLDCAGDEPEALSRSQGGGLGPLVSRRLGGGLPVEMSSRGEEGDGSIEAAP